MAGPILFCYDGSDGSREAMRTSAELLDSTAEAVVLTVWEPTALVLARSAPFGPIAVGDETERNADAAEAEQAAAVAREGAERATAAGWQISDRVERSEDGPVATIIEVANELDARLIVCGRRGRGPVAGTVLGSVSQGLIYHAGRPVLISPQG